MNEKKKTAPDDCSIEGGVGNQVSGPAVRDPASNCITEGSRRQDISALLPRGEENAVSTKTLVELTGCTSARQLQVRISAERARGALILSTERGYFLPAEGRAGRRELRRFVQTMVRRSAGTLRAAESAVTALAIMEDGCEDGKTR